MAHGSRWVKLREGRLNAGFIWVAVVARVSRLASWRPPAGYCLRVPSWLRDEGMPDLVGGTWLVGAIVV